MSCDRGRGCLRAGTMVHVPGGLLAVEALVEGALVVSCAGRARRVEKVVRSRSKKWIQVRTKSGAVLLTTQDHGLLMQDGWARAATLVPGDRLVSFVAQGPGAASALWSDERTWLGRRVRMDPRSLRTGPFPVPNLRDVARFDDVAEVQAIETSSPTPTFDLVIAADGGYIIAGILARAS